MKFNDRNTSSHNRSILLRRLITITVIATGIGLLSEDTFGQAGGVYLPENGGPINGTAQAGSAAAARDAETAFLNPAGMMRLEGTELLFTAMPTILNFQFNPDPGTTVGGSDGGNQGGFIPAAALYAAIPINDRVAAGFSMTSPAGLIIEPDDNWVGRNWTTKSALVALNLEPSVGVRISDKWSVGAGVDVQYVTFEQELVGPLVGAQLGIDGDSWDVGFSASVLWEMSETTRFGMRYRSQIAHDLKGDLTVSAGRQISTSFTLPMSVTFSGYHDLNDRFSLLADVGWTDWSAFDNNVISFNASGLSTELPRNFQDTWNFSLGAHYHLNEDWLLMFGGGYVSSAVSDADRTPDLPVDQQIRGSFGAEYVISERWKVGGSYTFAWLGENKIDQTRIGAGRILGDYSANVHMLGLYGNLSF
jgi:long-chain fatty acid transport protein